MNDTNKIINSRKFCKEVSDLALKYNLSFFLVTEGASITRNNGCAAVKAARDAHIKWEQQHNYDPYEDWERGE